MLPAVRVNTSHVVHETIDGETIMIHLETGKYFSIDGAGSQVWQWLAAGATGDELMAAANAHFLADPAELESELDGLIEVMVTEGLLVGEPQNGTRTPEGAPTALETAEGRAPFAMPALEVYTDMQEFMLVDPLHEADEVAGWPHARTG